MTEKPKKRHRALPADYTVGCVKSHFLDSGSFTLWTKAKKYAAEHGCGKWGYYDSDEFYKYMDDYAAFIKEYQVAIDLYANVDVIPNPELSWRNQQYLEKKHGLTPVPVVHYRTDLKWLRHYIRKGYDLIGLGGLVGSIKQANCRHWLDRCFELVCDNPKRLPCVKLHGFGVTSYQFLLRYPWYSVDSSSWIKIGGFGGILVPHKRGGKFIYDEPPYVVKISVDSPERKKRASHYLTLPKASRKIVEEWLQTIGMPLGEFEADGTVKVHGVLTRHIERKAANVLFFEELCKHIPEWPWPFRPPARKAFNIDWGSPA